MISNPITFAPLYYAAYKLGKYVAGIGEEENIVDTAVKFSSQWLLKVGQPLYIGLVIFGVVASLVTYFSIKMGWKFFLLAWSKNNQS